MWEKKNHVLVVGVGSLRLRSAQHPVSTTNSGCSEARQRRGQRGDYRDARATGHELVQAGGRRRASVHVAHRRSVPGHGPRQALVPGDRGRHLQPGESRV